MKIVSRWFVLKITDWYDIKHNISQVNGIIEDSNFLDIGLPMDITVLTKFFDGVDLGDTIKITLFTREDLISIDNRETISLADRGLKYEKLVYDTWELLYEDFPEHTECMS